MKNKKQHKKQYKLWVHIETWIDGEPVESMDEDPQPVGVLGSELNLFNSLAEAIKTRDRICQEG